jgi:hypothetical protein
MGKLKINLLFSTTCHPQTNGQTKIDNRTLTILLRIIIQFFKFPVGKDCLSFIKFAYNRSVCTTDYYFFRIFYGFNLLTPLDLFLLPIDNMISLESNKKNTGSKNSL